MKYFVTGGAGFIGSHIVDRLLKEGNKVTVYDNFNTGFKLFIKHNLKNKNFSIINADILNYKKLCKSMKTHDFVFHLAANADVRTGIKRTQVDIQQNTFGTYNVLESMKENNINKIAFSSSATVYGEPDVFPTPESYSGIQTSLYGASKLSAESLIEAYCEYYGIQSWIFRFVSFIGERYTHGVIFDFVKKLLDNPRELLILGNGNQKKSYLDVHDGIEGMFMSIKNFDKKVNIINLGHKDFIDVKTVADIICKQLNLVNVKYNFSGGIRGWKGDSPFVHLDISKLISLGWKPHITIEQGIIYTVNSLLNNKELLNRRLGGK